MIKSNDWSIFIPLEMLKSCIKYLEHDLRWQPTLKSVGFPEKPGRHSQYAWWSLPRHKAFKPHWVVSHTSVKNKIIENSN